MAIRLVSSREPFWIELGNEAAVFCDPATTMLIYAARAKANALMAEFKAAGEVITAVGGRIEGAPDISDDEHEQSALEAMFVVSLAELVIRDWRNILSADGTVLAFEPSLVSLLFEDETLTAKFLAGYLRPLHEATEEGNVSAI